MKTKQIKTVLVVCTNPTSTLTKGGLYIVTPVKAHAKACNVWWSAVTKRIKEFDDAYQVYNDKGKIVTVLTSRFKLK